MNVKKTKSSKKIVLKIAMSMTIGSSSHIAELAEKDGGPGHAPADMMQE